MATGKERQSNLEHIWGDLEGGLKQIYGRKHMTKTRYMELYTCITVFFYKKIGY